MDIMPPKIIEMFYPNGQDRSLLAEHLDEAAIAVKKAAAEVLQPHPDNLALQSQIREAIFALNSALYRIKPSRSREDAFDDDY